MACRIKLLLLSSFLVVASASAFGQRAAEIPEPSLTREQWQQRIEDARRRSEGFVAGARTQPATTQAGNGVSPESALTREQWQQRVEDARRQSEGFVASTRVEEPPTSPPARNGLPAETALTRGQWQQQIEDARLRSESFVTGARSQPATPSAAGEEAPPDWTLTREQWQQRVEDARRRSEGFVAGAALGPAPPLPSGFVAREASERAMNDPTLQQGDIVSTDRGFAVFVGRDEERRPGDFQMVPSQQYSPPGQQPR